MATDKEYLNTVRNSIVQILPEVQPHTIKQETSLKELGADSLDIVEIIMEIEERFDIEIDDHSLGSLKTVNDIINHLKENK